MTLSEAETNRQRVQNALVTLLDTDDNGNSYRYFHATELHDIDPEVSANIAGSHLPDIEDASPLENGIIVERHTHSRNNATLWIVRRESE